MGVPVSSHQSGRQSSLLLSPFVIFRSSTHGWGPPTLERAICFPQSTGPHVNFTQKHFMDSPRLMFGWMSEHPMTQSGWHIEHHKGLIWWLPSQPTRMQEFQKRSLESREYNTFIVRQSSQREESPFLKLVLSAESKLEQQKLVQWGTRLSPHQPRFPPHPYLPVRLEIQEPFFSLSLQHFPLFLRLPSSPAPQIYCIFCPKQIAF